MSQRFQIWWTRTGKAKSENHMLLEILLENLGSGSFPDGSDGKESTCNVGNLGSVPGSGRSPGEGNGNPLQCGESNGQGSLDGYSLQGHKQPDTTERLTLLPIVLRLCDVIRHFTANWDSPKSYKQ